MRIGPKYPKLGAFGLKLMWRLACVYGRLKKFYSPDCHYTREKIEALRVKIDSGVTVFVLGIGGAGHNAGVGLVSASRENGLKIHFNHEEERFRGIKHFKLFPELAVAEALKSLSKIGLKFSDLDAVVTTWNYPRLLGGAIGLVLDEGFPALRLLHPKASPTINLTDVISAFSTPRKLGTALGRKKSIPIINLRHHDNHAWFSYGVSPFSSGSGSEDAPVMIAVIDGMGDDASISLYTTEQKTITLNYRNRNVFDSLGMMYLFISSSQGGWSPLSSEGRYMGVAAWGDGNRKTNPFYTSLRDLFHFGENGEIFLNRDLANWHRAGSLDPYSESLKAILGDPIPLENMWSPDAVLNVDDIEHQPVNRTLADQAAAIQMIFEDALLHIIGHFIEETGSHQLVLTGGTALNCIGNLKLLETFDQSWYLKQLGKTETRLQLWVPPVPGDAGVPMGAAYHFCCLAGAVPTSRDDGNLNHAFYCGEPASSESIVEALDAEKEINYLTSSEGEPFSEPENLADLMAFLVAKGNVIALYQGIAETGPRALGHRSILANPCLENMHELLNSAVKFREPYRPLAPMVTLREAKRLFHLPNGVSADNFNACQYMALAVRARQLAVDLIPSVIHRDGTSRIQIVKPEVDPIAFAYLKAMGKHTGVEASVNTSLNVASPIVQSPTQAIETMKRSRGIDVLFLISEEARTFAAWKSLNSGERYQGHQFPEEYKLWSNKMDQTLDS